MSVDETRERVCDEVVDWKYGGVSGLSAICERRQKRQRLWWCGVVWCEVLAMYAIIHLTQQADRQDRCSSSSSRTGREGPCAQDRPQTVFVDASSHRR